MRIFGKRWDCGNDLYSGQDEGSETELDWTCEEEMRSSEEVREVGY